MDIEDGILYFNPTLGKHITDTLPALYTGKTDGVNKEVAIEFTYKNMLAVTETGTIVPSPIMMDYDYPLLHGLHKPFTHQEQIAEFLTLNKRGFCFAGMGTGKTASAIWAADYLMQIGEVKRVLIVSTRTALTPAWVSTLFGIVAGFTYTVITGAKKYRKKRAGEDTRYHIINHDGIYTALPELQAANYDLIIIDESTAYKTADTRRWKAIETLTSKAERVWMLTGSPTPKSPTDAYGQAKLMNPARVPKYYSGWENMVTLKLGEYRREPRRNSAETVREALSPAIYIDKNEVLKNRQTTQIIHLQVEQTKAQEVAIKELQARVRKAVEEDESDHSPARAIALTKYMQIMLGAVYAEDGAVEYVDSAPRIAAMLEAIEQGRSNGIGNWDEPKGKTIVAVPYRHVLALYDKAIQKAGYKVGIIHGGVATTQRTKIIQQFQHTHEIDVLLCVPDAIAHGLTLTAANTFVWCSPLIKPEIFQQANERMDRPGQTQAMVQVRLYSTAHEAEYYKVLSNREAWQAALLNLYNEVFL